MEKIKFEITMTVEDGFLHEAKRWEHHAEELLSLNWYTEIVNVSDCKVTKIEQ